jgi:ABC-type nitrate/sulfonate/bicarbonate transport system substrate-binding protein
MDKKIIVIAIVAVIVIASVGIYAITKSDDNEKDSSYTLISRVNTEGSGLYIKQTVLDERESQGYTFYTIDSTTGDYIIDESNADAWDMLIFGTPGVTSIQSIMLQTIVEQNLGLKFTLYQAGEDLQSGNVYYVSSITNATNALANTTINAGIIWQPQYQAIIDDSSQTYTNLGLTNYIFPDHTCCVLAGSTSYITSNVEVTERFLAAYVEGVDWVNEALADKTSDQYQELVELCVKTVGTSITVTEIEEALDTITYTYGDDSSTPLASLVTDVADLVDDLYELNSLQHTLSDLGFDNSTDFANKFVDDSYLEAALQGVSSSTSNVTVKVAVISGDIHQIALHAAIAQGFFADYGITVETAAAPNGAGVAVALQNGTVNFGLMGAPPATITTINSELIKA